MIPRRINVVGTSGSGKSTFSKELATLIHAPYIELDSIFWKPNWTQSSIDEMQEKIVPVTDLDSWVIDGNYSYLQASIWTSADMIIWLDTPKWLNIANVAKRALMCLMKREALWGHSRESLRRLFSSKSIVLWVWTTHDRRRQRYELAFRDFADIFENLKLIRLRSFREMRIFLDTHGNGTLIA